MNFLEACQRFIAIDSSPHQGTMEVAKLAAELCQEVGLFTEVQEESLFGLEQANVIARPQKEAIEGEVLLQAPLDISDPGSFGMWSATDNNPYQPTIRDGSIYGAGAAHGKLDFLCKLKAIEDLKIKSCKNPFVLVGTFGSENGSAGAVRLIRRKKVLSQVALVGGASDLKALYAGKGMATVEIRIPFSEEERRFRLEHDQMESSSSQSKMFRCRENEGENAIIKMMDYLEQLPSGISLLDVDGGIHPGTVPSYASLEFDMVKTSDTSMVRKIQSIRHAVKKLEDKFEEFQDPSFDPPYATINVGLVRTNDEGVIFRVVCNLPPSIEQSRYEDWMQELREASLAEEASFQVTEYCPSFRTALDSDLVKSCMLSLDEVGLDYLPITHPKSSEANVFKRLGMDCVVFGAGIRGESGQIANERNCIEDLEKSVEFYKNIISRLCL